MICSLFFSSPPIFCIFSWTAVGLGELRAMVESIASSLKSLCWTLVLIGLMIYIVSVYLTQLIADQGGMDPEKFHDQEDQQILDLRYYYGGLIRTNLSLFEAMTNGADWDTLVNPLIVYIHPLMGLLFTLYIAFAVLAMMNVVTAIFIETALASAKDDRDGDMVNQLRALFLMTDTDESGMISWEEFNSAVDNPKLSSYFKALDLDIGEARGLFSLLDVENTGQINGEEFVYGCLFASLSAFFIFFYFSASTPELGPQNLSLGRKFCRIRFSGQK